MVSRARLAGELTTRSGATPSSLSHRPTRLIAFLPRFARGRSKSATPAAQSDLPWRKHQQLAVFQRSRPCRGGNQKHTTGDRDGCAPHRPPSADAHRPPRYGRPEVDEPSSIAMSAMPLAVAPTRPPPASLPRRTSARCDWRSRRVGSNRDPLTRTELEEEAEVLAGAEIGLRFD